MECYRHPGRETNVSCSSCGNPICPDCMTPSPVGMRCPECAAERQKVIPARAAGQGTALDHMPVTVVLIGLNVLAFVAELVTGFSGTGFSGQIQGSVMREGVFFGPLVAEGQWWRCLTAGFLHLGVLHLGMNMLLLWFLGQLLEPAIGGVRFAVIYFASLLWGSLGAIVLEPTIASAGASGAIFGLMGAALWAFRSRGLNPFESGIGGLVILNLVITFAVPGISKGGHLGGLLGGVIVGAIIFALDEQYRVFGDRRWIAPALGALVGIAGFVATVVIAVDKFPQFAAL